MNLLKQKLTDQSKMFELFFLIYKVAIVISAYLALRFVFDIFQMG